MALKAAIVGRPNVGKSTLFNRLAGKKLALVHDLPGVTRDRKEVTTKLKDLELTVIDTAGYEEAPAGQMEERMWQQTRRAIEESDAVLFCSMHEPECRLMTNILPIWYAAAKSRYFCWPINAKAEPKSKEFTRPINWDWVIRLFFCRT